MNVSNVVCLGFGCFDGRGDVDGGGWRREEMDGSGQASWERRLISGQRVV